MLGLLEQYIGAFFVHYRLCVAVQTQALGLKSVVHVRVRGGEVGGEAGTVARVGQKRLV